MLKRLYDRMGKKVHSRYATPFLGMLFFIEAIFFLPTDPILILFCLEKRKQALWYATVATVASVIGGIAGYYIGFFLWETIGPQILHTKLVSSILSPKTFEYLCQQYKEHAGIAILIAGFSPITYKAATISAGICKLPLLQFIFFSLIARAARFYLLAIIIRTWGKQIKQYIDRYFNLLVILTVLIIVAGLWFLR